MKRQTRNRMTARHFHNRHSNEFPERLPAHLKRTNWFSWTLRFEAFIAFSDWKPPKQNAKNICIYFYAKKRLKNKCIRVWKQCSPGETIIARIIARICAVGFVFGSTKAMRFTFNLLLYWVYHFWFWQVLEHNCDKYIFVSLIISWIYHISYIIKY